MKHREIILTKLQVKFVLGALLLSCLTLWQNKAEAGEWTISYVATPHFQVQRSAVVPRYNYSSYAYSNPYSYNQSNYGQRRVYYTSEPKYYQRQNSTKCFVKPKKKKVRKYSKKKKKVHACCRSKKKKCKH